MPSPSALPSERAPIELRPQANQLVAHAICAALQRHRVECIIGLCSPMAIYYHAPEFGIRQVTMRTETAGAMIADGYARIAHKVGVVGAMGGPGAALLVPGLLEAANASVPIVAIVEDVTRQDTDKNAVESVDHQQLFATCAKWVRRVTQAERIDDYVDMAFREAATGRPGPAVLCVPRDLQFAPAAGASGRTESLDGYPLDRSVADLDRVEQAAEVLAAAARPVIVAGGGIHLSGAHQEVARLQALGIPVATTSQGKGAVDEDHPLSIGVVSYALGARASARHSRVVLDEADVILLVGTRTGEQQTNAWTLFSRAARFIHIDMDGREIGRNYEAMRLVGDAQLTLRALAASLERRGFAPTQYRAAVENRLRAARAAHARDMLSVADSDARPIRPERLMAEIDAVLTPESIAVADASFATIWVTNYLRSRRPGMRFITPRGLGGLGWGVPAAIGAKLAAPSSPVICIAGDGGFAYMWSELETLARNELPVVIVILNNQRLGFQVVAEDRLMGGHSPGAEFKPVDHAALARAAGCRAVRIEDPAALAPALRDALASNGPVLLDVIVDPDAVPPINGLE